jgi:hypothetical protein
VLYRLAEPGEVLGAGGKALTLVNLEDVYMEIFLPPPTPPRSKIGAEGGSPWTTSPGGAIGYVSFVSPEAQFTPKEVETKSEREKLMFRVKIQVPKALVSHYIEHIKTGVRGVGYVKVKDPRSWPDWLQSNLLSPGEPEPRRRRAGRDGLDGELEEDGHVDTRVSGPAAGSGAKPVVRVEGVTHRYGKASRSTTSRWTSRRASWSASSDRTASASPRCSG